MKIVPMFGRNLDMSQNSTYKQGTCCGDNLKIRFGTSLIHLPAVVYFSVYAVT